MKWAKAVPYDGPMMVDSLREDHGVSLLSSRIRRRCSKHQPMSNEPRTLNAALGRRAVSDREAIGGKDRSITLRNSRGILAQWLVGLSAYQLLGLIDSHRVNT